MPVSGFTIMDRVREVIWSVGNRDTGHDPVTGDTLAVCRADTGTLSRPNFALIPLIRESHDTIWPGLADMVADWASSCGRDPGYAKWMVASFMAMRPCRTDGMLMNTLCMGAAGPMAADVRVSMRMLAVLRGHDMYSRLMEYAPWPVEPIPLLASMRGVEDDPGRTVERAAALVGRAGPALDAIRRIGPPPVMDSGTLRTLAHGFTHGTGDDGMERLVLSLHADRRRIGPCGITRTDGVVADGRIGMHTERFLIRYCDWSAEDMDGALRMVGDAVRRGVGDGSKDWDALRTSGPDAGVLLIGLLGSADRSVPGVGAPLARLADSLTAMGLPSPAGKGRIPMLTADMTAAAARLLIEQGPLPVGFVMECAQAAGDRHGNGPTMVEPVEPREWNRHGILDLGPVALSGKTVRGRG